MAANLFGTRFVGARKPAWHSLGTVIPEGEQITVRDALRIGGLDFTYQSVPVGYTDPTGTFHSSDNRVVILRSPVPDDPQWREMGVVSNEYRYLQNVELANGLDAIARATGWSFETVGALGKGETVFMTLRTGKRSIFGDDYDTYIIVSDGKATSRALQISVAGVRVVCQNTLIAADNAATSKITINHTQAVRGEYGLWMGLIADLQKAQDRSFAELTQMASVKIDDEAAARIIHAAYPMPARSARSKQGEALLSLPTLDEVKRKLITERTRDSDAQAESAREQVINRRRGAFALYQRFNAGREFGAIKYGAPQIDPDTIYHVHSTPYAALQAVSELVDWGGSSSAQVAAGSALFGAGADVKARAWSAALKVAAGG